MVWVILIVDIDSDGNLTLKRHANWLLTEVKGQMKSNFQINILEKKVCDTEFPQYSKDDITFQEISN